jgi:hypothetical protein
MHSQIACNIFIDKNPSAMRAKYHTKNKGYIKSFIFHDRWTYKLDGHTKGIVVISDLFKNAVLCTDLQKWFSKIFKLSNFRKLINNVCLITSPKSGLC